MKPAVYGRITFASDYNESFAQFKDRFESHDEFRSLPEEEREKELKKAYKIATEWKTVEKKQAE